MPSISLSRRLAHDYSLKPEEAFIYLYDGRVILHLEAQRLTITCTGTKLRHPDHTTIKRHKNYYVLR